MDTLLIAIIIGLLLFLIAEVYLLSNAQRRPRSMGFFRTLVDTSAIMDGRILDLIRSGFIYGQIIVPRSVLLEMQLLADGTDHAKRERARFGMDLVSELKELLGDSFVLYDDNEFAANEGVDSRLLVLAKQLDAAILTIDYNLNKVARVDGIKVLNINELAKSLRMSYLPGNVIEINLTQKGQEQDQAIGHLSDGTMVVVERAKKHIGKSVSAEVVRSLQTDAGKMMFAKLASDDSSGHRSSAGGQRADRTTPSNKPKAAGRSRAATANTGSSRRRQSTQGRPPSSAAASRSRLSRSPKTAEDKLVQLANSQG